jgi:hypothetical protein
LRSGFLENNTQRDDFSTSLYRARARGTSASRR